MDDPPADKDPWTLADIWRNRPGQRRRRADAATLRTARRATAAAVAAAGEEHETHTERVRVDIPVSRAGQRGAGVAGAAASAGEPSVGGPHPGPPPSRAASSPVPAPVSPPPSKEGSSPTPPTASGSEGGEDVEDGRGREEVAPPPPTTLSEVSDEPADPRGPPRFGTPRPSRSASLRRASGVVIPGLVRSVQFAAEELAGSGERVMEEGEEGDGGDDGGGGPEVVERATLPALWSDEPRG